MLVTKILFIYNIFKRNTYKLQKKKRCSFSFNAWDFVNIADSWTKLR